MPNELERRRRYAAVSTLSLSALLFSGCSAQGQIGGGPPPDSAAGVSGESGSSGSGQSGAGAAGGASGTSGSSGFPGAAGVSGSGASGAGGTGGSAGSVGGSAGSAGVAGGGAGGMAGGGAGSAGSSGSAGASGSGVTCGGGSAVSGDVTVNLADVRQKISGFGASTAWGSTMSAADADTLWSTTTGAGLSLHRIRIDYQTGRTSELNIAKLAVARGVTVWATPWTPPAADKTGATGTNGEVEGTLSNPQAFGTFLAGFVSYMRSQGVPIYAVSAQNEPDANVTYESCVYTPASMAAFVGGTMGPALQGSGALIMAPETQNWCGFPGFKTALMNDANALRYTSIIATHEYGCNPAAYPEIAQAGKEFWETEIYDTGSSAADPGMPSALRVAKLIHDAMTIASMNAWHYWWVYPAGNDNGALWDRGTGMPSKRLWVEGNYSRFVRPGFQRVGTTGSAPSGVLVSAYKNPSDGSVAIVAINNNQSATQLSLFVSGAAPCSMTPWVTSSAESIASTAALGVASSRFTATLGAQSVTTFVGRP